MKILAIDTSCDDTAVSVIQAPNQSKLGTGQARKKGCFKILSNVVSSQVKIHQKYGGVYPTLAKREHQRNLTVVLKQALGEAGLLEKSKCQNPNVKSNPKSKYQKLKEVLEREPELFKELVKFLQRCQKPKIDVVAVTIGPGLEPCLWQGVNFAKALCFWWEVPIIPVNHIESHILANLIIARNHAKQNAKPREIKFPAVCLVVSGGHSQLVLMPEMGQYKIIGETLDDAAGECLDKTARILGLGYPGGPAIAAEARGQTPAKSRGLTPISLPRPMINSKNYDFSFSGLKTAVLYDYRKRPKKVRGSKEYIKEMAKEIQQAVIDVLIRKTLKAAKTYRAKTVILGGGVAANRELKKQFQKTLEKSIHNSLFLIPDSKFCTDNAAMVGVTAYFHLKDKQHWAKVGAQANLRINETND